MLCILSFSLSLSRNSTRFYFSVDYHIHNFYLLSFKQSYQGINGFGFLPLLICLSGIGAGHGLRDLGKLRTGADNTLAGRVVHVGDVLVLELGALPDLNLAAAAENADTHGGQEVVGGVGVVVDTTIEDGSGVLANGGGDEGLATGVVLDEGGHVMDDTSNSDEGLAVLGLGDKVVPADDGKLLQRSTPVEPGALLVELLLELLDTALLDFVGTELLEVVGEAERLPDEDCPLGGIVLPPLNGVAVIRGELVVEVVVSLAEGDESSDDVVTGRVAVVERLVSKPVGKRVDAEGGLLDEADTKDTAVDEAPHEVTPQQTAEEGRENQTHGDDTLEVVAVLPNDNGVLVEIGDVGAASVLGVLLHDHPSQVRVQQTLANGVRVLDGVGISVVGTVASGPPADGTLNSAGANSGQVHLKRQ